MNNAKIGTALVGGYLLGRKRRAKTAMGLALAMAARRAKSGDLAEALAPALGNLNRQARTELTDATRAAVGSVLNAQAGHLADALHQRTLGLQGQPGAKGGGEEKASRGEEPRDEEPRDERPREEEQDRTRKAEGRPSSQRARESDDD
ncbi:hypothetical protein [Streptomyces cinereospinus]|uniref:DNA primase n=1 Tax=Streptomyces cinereospinus TaxID=285561 RepID=A0ABV5N7M5_9ACTN